MINAKYIGRAPTAESWVAISSDSAYLARQDEECQQYIVALYRYLGSPPHGFRLILNRSKPYTYVEAIYDDSNIPAREFASLCAEHGPHRWADAGMEFIWDYDWKRGWVATVKKIKNWHPPKREALAAVLSCA